MNQLVEKIRDRQKAWPLQIANLVAIRLQAKSYDVDFRLFFCCSSLARVFFRYLLGLLCLLAVASRAEAIHFYQGRVAASASSGLQTLLPQALAQVLVKITANPAVTQLPLIQQALAHAQNYVQSYRYQTMPLPASSAQTAEHQRFLQVTFDENGIKQLLHAANQLVWTQHRPTILLWLVYQQADGERYFVTPSQFSALPLSQLTQALHDRGFATLWPLLDLTDRYQLPLSDVALLDAPLIRQASARYDASVFLAGIMQATPAGDLQTKWLLSGDNAQKNYAINAASWSAVLNQLLPAITTQLRDNFATADSASAQQTMTVTAEIAGVTNLDDFAAVSHYLRRLNAVVAIEPLSIGGQSVSVKLSLLGGINAMLHELGYRGYAATSGTHFAFSWKNKQLLPDFSMATLPPLPSNSGLLPPPSRYIASP